MLNISYSITAPLLQTLKEIEKIRSQILLTPLPLSTESKLQWQAGVERVYWSCQYNGNPLVKQQISKLLLSESNKRLNIYEKQAVNIKKAFDYIKYDWYVTGDQIVSSDIVKLNKFIFSGKMRDNAEIERLLDYLQVKPEHPVVQSAIAHYQLNFISPFIEGNEQTVRLFTYLILYKYGLDFRNLLVLDEYWFSTPKAYEYNYKMVKDTTNFNIWLDYFALGVLEQAKKALDLVNKYSKYEEKSPQWNLSDRQKKILSLIDKPDSSVSNKEVQKLFKVSQITASRDLSKLAKLGLLRARGQGRSVYYTKF